MCFNFFMTSNTSHQATPFVMGLQRLPGEKLQRLPRGVSFALSFALVLLFFSSFVFACPCFIFHIVKHRKNI